MRGGIVSGDRTMRVLVVHNHYLQAGGEDTVVQAEKALLEANGNEVCLFEDTNQELAGASVLTRARVALNAIYSVASRRRVAAAIQQFRPEVVHSHNFFNKFSPSVYDACHEAGVPVVQTLHNFRLVCLNAFLYRDGHTCEDCLRRAIPWPGVLHRCYQGSRAASATVAAMLTVHRAKDTWAERVTCYIALTRFAREKFVAAGLPAAKIVVKPNVVYPTPEPGRGQGGFALFVGRLSPEKGVETMLQAWQQIGRRLPLHIVGDGPLTKRVEQFAHTTPGLIYHGRLPRSQAVELMQDAQVMIFPSVWYEMFSMTAIEALSVGLPVIASNLGSMTELIHHQHNGLHFRPGDAGDLVAQVDWFLTHPAEAQRMGRQARADFEQQYAADRNYELLRDIYRQAIAERQRTR